MYRREDYEQLELEIPFGGTLHEDNRWVLLSKKIPWETIDQEYSKHFPGSTGQVALPSRLAFGALYIQTAEGFTDEQTRRNIGKSSKSWSTRGHTVKRPVKSILPTPKSVSTRSGRPGRSSAEISSIFAETPAI